MTALGFACVVAVTTGCDSEPEGPKPVDFTATATLDGAALTIEIEVASSEGKAGFEALGEHTSYWGADPPVPIRVPVEKLKPGAKTIAVTGGSTVKEIPIEAKIGWGLIGKTAKARKTRPKAAKSRPRTTYASATLGEDITFARYSTKGVKLVNLQGGLVQGRPLVVQDNVASLEPDYLALFRDHVVEDVLPKRGFKLEQQKETISVTFDAELEDWFGKKSKHTVQFSTERELARLALHDYLRNLAKRGGGTPNWQGGRAVFVASDAASDGSFIGSAKKFSDLGFVAWVTAKPGKGRVAGKCSYVGATFDHIVKDADVTLRSLEDGKVVAQGTLKGRAKGCPTTVYASQKDKVLVSRPRPEDARAWIQRNLPAAK